MKTVTPILLSFLAMLAFTAVRAETEISVEKLPEPGVQPQAIATPDGTVHLIYLTGNPSSSDILYRWRVDSESWSDSLRVNSEPGSAVAMGTIRGPHLALGRNGRVHVVWNGSESAAPKPANGGSPMLYARLNDDGKGFSTQKNLMTTTHGLDGGGSVSADTDGRVFVVWHGAPPASEGETNRAVFCAESVDDGVTFAPERRVSPSGTGACGCCGLTAFADVRGDVFVLFRTARSMMQRDMMLLVSSDHGARFKESFTHPWSVGMCPMSSASLIGWDQETWAAWETAGQVYCARFSNADKSPKACAVGPLSGAKHPRLAFNNRGEVLMVWTEGTSWQRGGAFAWQMFDTKGEPTSQSGRRDGVPAWSYATAYARPNGDFVVLY